MHGTPLPLLFCVALILCVHGVACMQASEDSGNSSTLAALFHSPRAACDVPCSPSDVRLSWMAGDMGRVARFHIRLNREGCQWFSPECGDRAVHDSFLDARDICTRRGACSVRVAIEPDVHYKWSVTAYPVPKEDEGLRETEEEDEDNDSRDEGRSKSEHEGEIEQQQQLDGVSFDTGVPVFCTRTTETAASRKAARPLSEVGSAQCFRSRKAPREEGSEVKERVSPVNDTGSDTTMDSRHWLPLFEELHNPLTRSAADSRAWMATFVRPSACTFRNVAADDKYTYIFVTDPALRVRYEEQAKSCYYDPSLTRTHDLLRGHNGKSEPWCYCFHRERLPRFVDPHTFRANCASSRVLCGPALGLEQYHRAHHWGHFVEGVGMLHALLVAAANVSTSDGSTQSALFADVEHVSLFKIPSLLETERQMLETALRPLGWRKQTELMQRGRLIFGATHFGTSPLHWYRQLTYVASTRAIAYSGEQAAVFRRNAYLQFGWEAPKSQRCRPLRCALLYRVPSGRPNPTDSERRMSNEAAVVDAMVRNGCPDVTTTFISGDFPLRRQANFFRAFNLIVSSHSSQLLGLVFAPPDAHVIEVFPMTTNPDFAFIGQLLTVDYFFAWGGEAQFQAPEPELVKVMERMNECGGTYKCFRQLRSSRLWNHALAASYFKYSAFQQYFTANVTAVEVRVRDAVRHHWLDCAASV